MKFLALTALVAIVAAKACTEEELADDANCDVTGDDDVVTCTPVADDVTCDEVAEEEEEEEEEEASSALFASAATLAVAATMMY